MQIVQVDVRNEIKGLVNGDLYFLITKNFQMKERSSSLFVSPSYDERNEDN